MSAFNGSPQVGGITNTPRRAYITTAPFNNDFYTYTTSMNPTTFRTTGALVANVPGATALTCPANRILRENGRRLYPEGANPDVNTLMVGVYDSITGFKGFIDPNAPIFAVYNTDKSYQTPNGINPNGGLLDQGPPIYTRGPTTLYGGVDISGGLTVTQGGLTVTAGGLTVTAGGLNVASGNLRASTVTTSTTTTGTLTINPTLGNTFVFTATMTGAVTLAVTAGTPASCKGQNITVLFIDGGGRTFIGDGTTVKTTASATMTNAKSFAVNLVSDGNFFYQTDVLQYT
jgi:hypothetical protein